MIEIKNLSLHYSSGFTLNLHSLTLASEQTHVFLGSSGSGKTTLLKAILGLEKPSSGTVKIFSEDVNAESQVQLAKLIGYVPQEGGLFPHLTCAQNASLPGRIARMPAGPIAARLEELRQLVGIDHEVLKRYPREVSGGQRQRVALMRALFTDPRLILLDEPLGALDPIIRSRLQEDLKQIFNQLKKLVVIVTHDLSEAAYFGHTIALFHRGQLLQHSSLQEMVRAPKDPFVTEFLNANRGFSGLEFKEPRS